MAIYTYLGNVDPNERTGQISLRGGALLIPKGSYADLTPQEYAALASRYVLAAGIVGPAVAASLTLPWQGFTYRGIWAPATDYVAYDVVTYAGRTYSVRVAFTSGAAFDPTNLNVLADKGQAELAYAEITSNFAAGTGAITDVTGLSFTLTPTSTRPIYLEAFASQVRNVTAGILGYLVIYENDVIIAQSFGGAGHAANQGGLVHVKVPRRALVPGTPYTYKVAVGALGGGPTNQVTVGALAGGNVAYLSAVEL